MSKLMNRIVPLVHLMPLRTRIIRLIFLILFPAVLLTLLNSEAQWTLASHGVEQEALRLAQVVASNQAQMTESAEQLLVTLAEIPQVKNGETEACNQIFERQREKFPHYTNIFLVDANGDTVCSGLPGTPNVKTLPWFVNTLERRDFTVGEYAIGIVSKRPIITYSVPIFDDQQTIRYLLGVGLDLEWVASVIDDDLLPAKTTVTALDRNGTVIYA
ncbi:MAG TPA: PDC sensor domain-containing protein, partial [Phototrophicaceae bacterium]|nr:PDC sensor domain-containing protein [Phototrophicaceae bacterium]